MKSKRQEEWQRRRSDFNHNWLKNKILPALDSAANLMQGKIRGATFLEELMTVELSEWPERKRELEALLDDFESDMSPRKLMSTLPMSEWEASLRDAMADLLHRLWHIRYPVSLWLQDARQAAVEVNSSYLLLQETLIATANGTMQPEFSSNFEIFRSACRKLSKAIEKFPNRILVL